MLCVFFVFRSSFLLLFSRADEKKHKLLLCVLLKPFYTVFVPCWHQDGHAQRTHIWATSRCEPHSGGQPTTPMSVLHPRRSGLGFLVLFHASAYPSELASVWCAQRRGFVDIFFVGSFFQMVGMFYGNNNHINLKKIVRTKRSKSILNCSSVMVRMKEMDQGLLKIISIALINFCRMEMRFFFSPAKCISKFSTFGILNILDFFYPETKNMFCKLV